jgi:hypothetical protein
LVIDFNIENIRFNTKTLSLNELDEQIENIMFSIPKDLEFYITSGDIKCFPFCDCFKLSFYATSMCYVLTELQSFIQGEIYKNEYPTSEPQFDNIIKYIQFRNKSLFDFIVYVREHPSTSIIQISKDLNISQSTVSKNCELIAAKFKLQGEKGIKKIREFVKKIPDEFFTN